MWKTRACLVDHMRCVSAFLDVQRVATHLLICATSFSCDTAVVCSWQWFDVFDGAVRFATVECDLLEKCSAHFLVINVEF